MLTVGNLPEEEHRALRARAEQHGRSTEAEVRAILISTVHPEGMIRLGDALAGFAQDSGLTNEAVDLFNQARDSTPAEPWYFK